MKKRDILDIGNYSAIVHVTRYRDNEVNWFGHFTGIDGYIVEGMAFQATSERGRPVIQRISNTILRLHRDEIVFAQPDYFKWHRSGDTGKYPFDPKNLRIPCIAITAVKETHLFDDPKFTTIRRKIAVVVPVLHGDTPSINVSFVDEFD